MPDLFTYDPLQTVDTANRTLSSLFDDEQKRQIAAAKQNSATQKDQVDLDKELFNAKINNPIAASAGAQALAATQAAGEHQAQPPGLPTQTQAQPVPAIPGLPAGLQAGDAQIRGSGIPGLPQQAPAIQDKYSGEEAAINADEQLLGQRKQHAAIAAFNPADPSAFVPNMDAANQKIQAESQSIAQRRLELNSKRAADAQRPQVMQAISDAITVPEGGFTKEAESLKNQKLAQIFEKYPLMASDPAVAKVLELAKQAQPNFNVMGLEGQKQRAQTSQENNLRGQNTAQTKDYEVAKRGATTFQADYENYKQQLASGNQEAIKAAQQGMVDKYITTSTGKSTGEAQFKNFIEGNGLINTMQNLGDKLMNGSMNTEQVFDAIHDITMATAEKVRQKTLQQNEATKSMAEALNNTHGWNIDPDAVTAHPTKMLVQDSVAYAPKGLKATPEQISLAKQYESLPANSPYRNPTRDANMKKILGQ